MCGIVGILNHKSPAEAEQTVAKMVSMLRHRGLDETGLYVDPEVCLGHARLSILGLECGIQPMANRDQNLWISYNGEIFNYLELQQQLEQKGYRFTTGTDTEVLLALYEEFGADCLPLLNGQFSFAIWDGREKELFLARDRVGIRPLFYTRNNGRFSFASEIKALFAVPSTPRRIDARALIQVFTFWTTVTPGTAFTDIYELPPGHCMKVTADGAGVPRPYWTIPYLQQEQRWQGSFDGAAEELLDLLKDAVRLRLRADVPVGAYLSGGLDSSILTTVIAKNFNNKLRTFSLSFQENSFDESSYQNEMVDFLQTDHSDVRVSNQQVRDDFPAVVRQCEKPLVRTGPVPLFSLSRHVRENDFKVVLTGEGADEVFGGYNIYKEAKLRRFWARQPDSAWRPQLVERLYPYIFKDPKRARMFLQQFFAVSAEDLKDPFFSHRVRWKNSGKNEMFFSPQLKDQLDGYDPYLELAERLPQDFGQRKPFDQAQFLEMEVFLANYLLSSQGDRVGMGNSIELRVPFLDHRVIDFASKLPAHWKLKGLNEKYILKQSVKGMIPERVRVRDKQPYRAPIKESFIADGQDSWIAGMLDEQLINSYGYFDADKVKLLAKRFGSEAKQAAGEVQNMALTGILSTQLLHKQFIEDFDPAAIEPVVPDKLVRNLC